MGIWVSGWFPQNNATLWLHLARFSALLKIQDRAECGNTQTELKKEEINHNAIYDYNNGSAVVVAYGVTNYSW